MSKGKRVVIVGAGPAGLVTALGLARQGAQVTVIDREADVVASPRAMVYLPSTLKVLDELGLLDDAKAVGALSHDYNMRFPLSGRVGAMDHRIVADLTPYAYILHFGQHVLAQIVMKHLLALPGTAVRWHTAFAGCEQSADAVQVTVTTERGEETLEADWLIGADGAGSSVRKAMGVGFEGFTWPDIFMATNVLYDFHAHGWAANNMIGDPVHWAVIAKINDQGLWRIAYGEDGAAPEDVRLGRIRAHFKHLLPVDTDCEIVLANAYRVHQRCAASFRQGRVLLVGDAAHATNPIGGMGFTSGVQDASLLIKMLGAVINGQGGDDLLDWYAYERRRVFLEIANPTAIEFKRRTQEADPARRREDEANFFKMMADRDMMRGALMSIFALGGRPYQADWRQTLLKDDQAGRTPTLMVSGANVTAQLTAEIEPGHA